MHWAWFGVGFGLLGPWVVIGKHIALAFREKGFRFGLTYWLGAAIPFLIFGLPFFWFTSRYM